MLHIYIIQIQDNFANKNLNSPYVFSYPSPTKNLAIGLNFLHFDLSTYPPCQHKHKAFAPLFDFFFTTCEISLWQMIVIIWSTSITNMEPNSSKLLLNFLFQPKLLFISLKSNTLRTFTTTLTFWEVELILFLFLDHFHSFVNWQ
jgi:hypothetical protein